VNNTHLTEAARHALRRDYWANLGRTTTDFGLRPLYLAFAECAEVAYQNALLSHELQRVREERIRLECDRHDLERALLGDEP